MKKIWIIIVGFLCTIGTEILAYIVFYRIWSIRELWHILFLTGISGFICLKVIEYLLSSCNKRPKERFFYLLFIIGLGLGIVCAGKYTEYTATGPDIGFYVIETILLPVIIWLGILSCRLIIGGFFLLFYKKKLIKRNWKKQVCEFLFVIFWMIVWSVFIGNQLY